MGSGVSEVNPELNGLGIKFNKSDVSRVCNGARKHTKHYTFKYESKHLPQHSLEQDNSYLK